MDIHSPPFPKPSPETYLREHACDRCAKITTQTKHGFTVTGELWKGHVCECCGWECTGCREILDAAGECCR